jgi:predicted lipoprotein with Yx(FWY)xxD motif
VKRTTLMFAALLAVAALAIAGCGGGSSSSSSSTSSESGGGEATNASAEAGGSGGEGTIGATEISGLGEVLVDSEGMTVYLFTPDKGTTSTCYGECEKEWPPVVASGKPTAGEGAMSAALGTTKRKDGTMQVTYEGHPLYTFADDDKPGEANGQEDDGVWFVLDESGEAVEGKAAGASESSDDDGDTTTTESEAPPAGGGGGY